jgi:hypothetical protein
MVFWLFFNFAVSFDFVYCSLAQEMSFVDYYLPFFRQWLITHLLLALLPFQPLFTESPSGDQLLAPPPFSSAFSATSTPCYVLVFSSLFIAHFFVGRGQSAQGAMLLYSRGGWGKSQWGLVLTCWSAECLPCRFVASIWWHSSPPVFSV